MVSPDDLNPIMTQQADIVTLGAEHNQSPHSSSVSSYSPSSSGGNRASTNARH